MKKIEHRTLMELWWKIWEMLENFLLRFDPQKIKAVMTTPHHQFWVNLTELLLKPLMHVPGDGLNLVKVHKVGLRPARNFGQLFKSEGVRFSNLEPNMFPPLLGKSDCNRILEFGSVSEGTSDEFFRKFLGSCADRSQLPGKLISGGHLMSVADIDEIILHPESYGIKLDVEDRAVFFVSGVGLPVRLVSVEYPGGRPLLNTHGGSIFDQGLRWATRIFIADPDVTIPDSMGQA